MFDFRQMQRNRQVRQSAKRQREWGGDRTRQQRREQMELIRELGQLQITPAGYVD
jgi:hypothetical protein